VSYILCLHVVDDDLLRIVVQAHTDTESTSVGRAVPRNFV
jgi:hypothetical protein